MSQPIESQLRSVSWLCGYRPLRSTSTALLLCAGLLAGNALAAPPAEPPPEGSCMPGVPGTSQLRRLTNRQYDNTIRDLLFLEGRPSSGLLPDAEGSVSADGWTAYGTVAESLAAQLMADPTARAKALPCPEQTDECADRIIQELGLRAFRRPLSEKETATHQQLYTERATLTTNGSFDEAVQLIVSAFLQSPSFVMRAELSQELAANGYFALSSYEVATRLSYMLWESMPDPELFEAAASDELQGRDQIYEQARRMLLDEKSHSMVSGFHEHYMKMGEGSRWTLIAHDSTIFPEFNAEQVPAMLEEARLIFDDVTFAEGTFQDLLLTPVAYVNATLAPLYGLDASTFGSDLTRVELDPATRPGVFTRVGFLAAYSAQSRTSPILRGAFLQQQVLCTKLGDPPPEAGSRPLPEDAALLTNRARVEAQTADPACAGCHEQYINPAGFALEAFNAVGAAQSSEANGVSIDTSGDVRIGNEMVAVAGPAELMTVLAASIEARRCYAEQWVTYAYGRLPNAQDDCVVEELTQKLVQGGYTILDLIADLTQGESFRFRSVAGEPVPSSSDTVAPLPEPEATATSTAAAPNPMPTLSADPAPGGSAGGAPNSDDPNAAPSSESVPVETSASGAGNEDTGERDETASDAGVDPTVMAIPSETLDAASPQFQAGNAVDEASDAKSGCSIGRPSVPSPGARAVAMLALLGLARLRRNARHANHSPSTRTPSC